jgi:hypothetical protein
MRGETVMILRQTTIVPAQPAVSHHCDARAGAGGCRASATATVKQLVGAAQPRRSRSIDRKMPGESRCGCVQSGGAAGLRRHCWRTAVIRVTAEAPAQRVSISRVQRTGPVDHYRHRQTPAVLGCWRSGCEAQAGYDFAVVDRGRCQWRRHQYACAGGEVTPWEAFVVEIMLSRLAAGVER